MLGLLKPPIMQSSSFLVIKLLIGKSKQFVVYLKTRVWGPEDFLVKDVCFFKYKRQLYFM